MWVIILFYVYKMNKTKAFDIYWFNLAHPEIMQLKDVALH